MADILKGPYQLSLWERRPDGEEKYIMLIGSDSMTTPYKAQNVIIKTKVNTEKILTFSLYFKYFDNEIGAFRENPLCSYLHNECLLKLHRGNIPDKGWSEFVIKDIQESSDSKVFTYTAKNAFQLEMAKTGYGITLSSDLMNNMGTAVQLTKKIFEDSDWEVEEIDSDKFWGNSVEVLYKGTLNNNFTHLMKCIRQVDRYDLYLKTVSEEKIVYPEQYQEIYIPFSSLENAFKNKELQFLWSDNGVYEFDEKNVLYTANSYVLDLSGINKANLSEIKAYLFEEDFELKLEVTTKKGDFLQNKINSFYVPNIDKVVTKGTINNTVYYEFLKTDYITSDSVHELAINNRNFENTYGWLAKNESNIYLSYIDKDYESIVNRTENSDLNCLYLASEKSNAMFYNGGVLSNISYINGFFKGEEYCLKINGTWLEGRQAIKFFVAEEGKVTEKDSYFYAVIDNEYDPSEDEIQGYGHLNENIVLTCKKSISKENLVNKKLGFYITFGDAGKFALQEFTFYKCLIQSESQIEPGTIPTSEILEKRFYILGEDLFDENNEIKKNISSLDNLVFRELVDDEVFVPEYCGSGYEKVTSIEVSKTNRFNALQEICEAFGCWADLCVEYDDFGFIQKAEGASEKFKKSIKLKNFIGKNRDIGFSYGLNLKDIKRDIVSDQIVTKLIVEQNNNEHAPNGFCSIIRAEDNIPKTNFLYDFSYYVNQKILTADDLNEINEALKSIGKYNSMVLDYNEQLLSLEETKFVLEKDLAFNNELFDALGFEVDSLKQDFYDRTSKSYNSTDLTNEQKNDSVLKGIAFNIVTKTAQRDECENALDKINEELIKIKTLINNFEGERKNSLLEAEKEINALENKYISFIQEGTWQDDSYINDDLYYYDANAVLSTSSMPKINYTFNVIDVTPLGREYEPYSFEVGDKTYIEDTEFFGWNGAVPYREEVVISEMEEHLDSPEENRITIQNYKTQFEDLFQRINATTQSLQYAMGAYQRAANKITSENEIDAKTLQNSLLNSVLDLQNMGNLSVSWTKNGLIVKSSDSKNSHKQLRLSNTGLSLSTDGGLTWRLAINGDGIVANEITTGTINTNKITIKNGDIANFIWDTKGLRAYKSDFEANNLIKVDYQNYIEFNAQGLKSYSATRNSIGEIIDEGSPFELTADGRLTLKGKITATEGSIGGWKIDLKTITAGGNLVGLSSENRIGSNQAIWAGRRDSNLSIDQVLESFTLDENGQDPRGILLLIKEYQSFLDVENSEENLSEEEKKNKQDIEERLTALFEVYEKDFGILASNYMLTIKVDYRIIAFWESPLNGKTYFFFEILKSGKEHIALILEKNAKFYVTFDGNLYAQNAFIEGHIDAREGTLQNLQINGNLIVAQNGALQSDNYIPSSAGWRIDDSGAEFNSITVRGALKVASFEYGEVSAVGGIILVRPSTLILGSGMNEIDGKQYAALEVEDASQFTEGDRCIVGTNIEGSLPKSGNSLDYEVTSGVVAIKTIEHDFGRWLITFDKTESFSEDVKNHVLVSICKIRTKVEEDGEGKEVEVSEVFDNVFIAINSSNNNAFAIPKSISLGENRIGQNGNWERHTKVFLGEFPEWSNKGPVYNYLQQNGKYGLYAEGAYISGIIASYSSAIKNTDGSIIPARSAGIWSESTVPMTVGDWEDKGNIIFWTGQLQNGNTTIENLLQTASVQIDDRGHLYAKGAFVEGEVKITSGTIGGVSFDAIAEKAFECDIEKTSSGLMCHIYSGIKEMEINDNNTFRYKGINYSIEFKWLNSNGVLDGNNQSLSLDFPEGENVYTCEVTITEIQ